MCLEIINKEKTENFKKQTSPIIAYKVMARYKRSDGNYYYYSPFRSSSSFVFNKGKNEAYTMQTLWCEKNTISTVCPTYPSGFHSFLYLQDAINASEANYNYNYQKKNRIVVEISIDPKDVVAVGEQLKSDVIVSSTLTIKSFKNLKRRKVDKICV